MRVRTGVRGETMCRGRHVVENGRFRGLGTAHACLTRETQGVESLLTYSILRCQRCDNSLCSNTGIHTVIVVGRFSNAFCCPIFIGADVAAVRPVRALLVCVRVDRRSDGTEIAAGSSNDGLCVAQVVSSAGARGQASGQQQ